MKIYTEVNYEWKNGSLSQTSSKSFDYDGEISECKGGSLGKALGSVSKKVTGGISGGTKSVGKGASSAGGLLNKAAKNIGGGAKGAGNFLKDPMGTIAKGPGGTFGDITDAVYGGSFKDMVEGAQGKTEEESVDAPTLAAEEVDASAALAGQNQKRKQAAGRGAANLTAGQSATMLTS
jgi:hypothetical protein